MTSPAITISSDATLADAAALMLGRRIGCLPVLDAGRGEGNGRLMGLITDDSFFPRERLVPHTHERFSWLLGGWLGDLDQLGETLRALGDHSVVEGLIERHPVNIEAPLAEIARQLLGEDVHHVAVVNGDEVVGVISRHDMAKLVLMA